MQATTHQQVFAPDGVVFARPPSPVGTLNSRYMAGAGDGLENGLDLITGLNFTLPNQPAVICSSGVCAEKSLRLISRSGLKVPSDVRPYRTGEDALDLARAASRRGEVLELQFPPADGELLAATVRVSADLVRRLNNKAWLDTLIAPEHLARRQVLGPAEVRELVARDRRPAVIKPAGTEVYSGIALFTRRLQERQQRSIFQELERVSDVWVVEEEIRFRTVWGLQFAVLTDGEVSYLGASVHLPQPTSVWVGCVIDDEQPPAELVEAVAAGVRTAAGLGYRGYCSFDAGVTFDGEPRVIDPNFRLSGATSAIVHRSQLPGEHRAALAAFWNLPPGVDAGPALVPFIDVGQLIVFMHFDPAETGNAPQPATIYGLVGAASRAACGVLVARIQRALNG